MLEFEILNGVCNNPTKDNNTICNDGNACTQTDTCQSGICTGANPIICIASDQCHNAGVCDSSNGICNNPEKNDGATCNDGNACTQTDTCQSGSCSGTNPIICSILDQCHNAGVCDPSNGVCDNPAKDDGSSCNDQNACTQSDSCSSGTCIGSDLIVCVAFDQCHSAEEFVMLLLEHAATLHRLMDIIVTMETLAPGAILCQSGTCVGILIQLFVLHLINATMLDTVKLQLETALNRTKSMVLNAQLQITYVLPRHNVKKEIVLLW